MTASREISSPRRKRRWWRWGVAVAGLVAVAAYYDQKMIVRPMVPPEVHIAPARVEMVLPAGEDRVSSDLQLVCTLTNRGPRPMRFNRFYACWAGIFQRADGTELRAQGFAYTMFRSAGPEDFPMLAPGGSAVQAIPCHVGRPSGRVWWFAFDRSGGQCATRIEPGRYRFRLEYHPRLSTETTRSNAISPGVDLSTVWSGTVPSNWIDLTIADASTPR